MKHGYDLSEHNGAIDISQLKTDFVILRLTVGQRKDKMVENYVNQCKKYGVPFGLYSYSYSLSKEDAQTAAKTALSIIKQMNLLNEPLFKFPFVLDIEDADHWKENTRKRRGIKKKLAEIEIDVIETWKKIIEDEGMFLQLYCNLNDYRLMKSVDHKNIIQSLSLWLAHWGTNQPGEKCDMWQYTSSAIDYRGKRIDANKCFIDFPIECGKVKRPLDDNDQLEDNVNDEEIFIKMILEKVEKAIRDAFNEQLPY